MKTYEQIRGYPPDFVVRYRLHSPAEGGRQTTHQHPRWDFMYEGSDPLEGDIFMIHPEFLASDGAPLDDKATVPLEGNASMWILDPTMRPLHRSRIKVGVKGFFMEGHRKLGSVEVTMVIGLHEKPGS